MYARFGKRLFDLCAALIAIIALSPILLLIALGVVMTSPGPAIFRQQRSGAGGRLFRIYKYRSMPQDTGDIASDALANVTIGRFGQFIRRTNLDELPQLFNILKGDMSVVGPRPALPSQNELLDLRRESGAIACRPGLTGLAQINSFDGMSILQKAQLDGEYVQQLGFSRDMVIILRTFGYLLRPPPVY